MSDVAGETDGTKQLQGLVREYGGRWGAHAIAAMAGWRLAEPQARKLRDRLLHRDDFTITVPGTDDIYTELHDWVLSQLPDDDRKALIATSRTARELRYAEVEDGPSRSRQPPRLRLQYDGQREHKVLIHGHRVIVRVARDPVPDRVNLSENWRQLTEHIMFLAVNAPGRDAVVKMLEELLAKRHAQEGPPPLYIGSRWGGHWTTRQDVPARPLESVILKYGQLEGLVHDMRRFLHAEGEYARLSQPWHRGYLFHGAPGTGKTSVARALANEFDLPTYYLPLGDLDHDADLMGLVSAIGPRSILLIEDIDVFATAKERTEDGESVNPKASLASMLNALDGIWTPHGLITILTTNRPEVLDDALLRPGRVDRKEEFSDMDHDQARRLAAWLDTGLDWERFVGLDPASMIAEARDMVLA